MSYKLFIDDERDVKWYCTDTNVVVCRSSTDAINHVKKNGMPDFLYLDHDLGGDDTAMIFLKWLATEYWNGESDDVPGYSVHSSNPAGRQNIIAYMESWWHSRFIGQPKKEEIF